MGMNTMKFCSTSGGKFDQQRAKAFVGEKMREKMMTQVKSQIHDIMAKKQEMRRRENAQHTDAFKSQISLAHSATDNQFSRNSVSEIKQAPKTTSEVMEFDLRKMPKEVSNA